MRIEQPTGQPSPPIKRATRVMNFSTIKIIEPNQNVAARLGQLRYSGKRTTGIIRVMQNTVGNNKVKKTITQRRPKEIHLGKGGALDAMCPFEILRQQQ